MLDKKTAISKSPYTYVDFWASWCPTCLESFPWLEDIHQKYQPKGLRLIGVNVDVKRVSAEKFLQENPVNFDIIYDPNGKIATWFELNTLPSSYIINQKGEVVFYH